VRFLFSYPPSSAPRISTLICFKPAHQKLCSQWSRNRPPTKTLQDAKTLILNRLPSASKPFIENYAIILKPDDSTVEDEKKGEMIGVIGIPRLSHDGLAAEVGYGITPAFWGRGYASEALSLFVRHYFNSKSMSIFLLFSSLSFFDLLCWEKLDEMGRKGRKLMPEQENSKNKLSSQKQSQRIPQAKEY
jgi:hypothetical protein